MDAARYRQLDEERARREWLDARTREHAADWAATQAQPAATGGGWTPPAYPTNDNYYRESQHRQAVTASLWRYTYGQQDWYLTD